ncbi:MAG: hypothetical protein S4CHLAM123_01210 [Chlamydiales bacterium]|nr:hypothetical protein [Chlamydiales bacterium]
MTKRFFLILFVFTICASSALWLLKPNSQKQVNKALGLIKNQQFTAAQSALAVGLKSKSLHKQALYNGYLELAKGDYDSSEKYLLKAQKSARGQKEPLQEILLTRAINAYQLGKEREVLDLVDTANGFGIDNPFLDFFKGLAHYINHQYKEALDAWDHSISETCDSKQEWMQTVIEKAFPHSWRELHKAHTLAESGEILPSREILEQQGHLLKNQNPELHALSTLFLGLTYLKEAQTIPLDQRASYYKLACFYFGRAVVPSHFSREKEQMVAHLEKEAESLFASNALELSFNFIHTLEAWNAQEAIENLSERLTQKIQAHYSPTGNLVCATLQQEFLGSSFHTLIIQKLLHQMAFELKQGDPSQLFSLWSLVESLSTEPHTAAKQIASLTSVEIFETIKKDSQDLALTRRFIKFWEQLAPNSQEKLRLANELIFHSKLFWLNETQEKKGQRLMELALELSDFHLQIHQEIEFFLTRLYSRAENSNMIHRLTLIHDAMDVFQITRQELVSKSTLANHLADANYLYTSRNYQAAKAHATWVLKREPQNEGARKLVGLCAFHLGEYDKALNHLQRLRYPDKNAEKALMLCRIFNPQEPEKHLCQINTTENFVESE